MNKKMVINADFYSDFNDLLANFLENKTGIPLPLDSEKYPILIFNRLIHIPKSIKRKIEYSSFFLKKTRSEFKGGDNKNGTKLKKIECGWNNLREKIEKGVSLKSHLSRKMDSNNNHVDSTLLIYNINHFHLGIEPDEKHPNMVKGGKFVVYAIVTGTHFYAIDILDHSLFNNIDKITEMLNGVKKDWPDLIHYRNILSKLNFNEINDNPLVLKRRDFVPAIKLNSGMFFSGLNTTVSGSSVLAVRNHLIIKNNMQIIQCCFERMINDNIDFYKKDGNGAINAILTLSDEGELIITSQELGGFRFRTNKYITDIIGDMQD